MEYSAVTQPCPLPRSHGGRRSSTLAVQMTRVSPETDQATALGMAGIAGFYADGPHFVGRASGWSHERLSLSIEVKPRFGRSGLSLQVDRLDWGDA